MIALDLSQLYNQVLLITYLKFTKKNAKGAWKEKKTKSVCNFIGLKSHKLNYECKKCKKRWKTLLMKIIHMLKKIFEELKLKNLGDYHDLYVQSDTLLLADVFENFRNKCIEIYELDPAHFLSAPGLAWQACLKKTEVELQ